MCDDPDSLWRAARDAPSQFERLRLFEEAANVLITNHGGELRRFCLRHLEGDEPAADDVAQRAFMTLWRVMPRFAGRSNLKTFLFGIAHNLCLRARRDDARAARLAAEHSDDIRDAVHADDLVDLDGARERRDRVRVLEECLATMDARDAWLLRARLVDELGYDEILPRFRARFGDAITTLEGLRTAFFRARRTLEDKLARRR